MTIMDVLENEFLKVCLTPYAASIESVFDKRTGKDLVLCLGSEEAHLRADSYSGNTIGAYAGRIRGAELSIGGEVYHLDRNGGTSSLHGGSVSLRRVWDSCPLDGAVVYRTTLSHMEDGLPGERRFCATYRLEDDSIHVNYRADSDRGTFFNLTNHLYLTLDPDGDERNDLLCIDSRSVAVNDISHIPVGIVPVEGTLFDFRKARRIGNLDNTDELGFSRGLNNLFFLDGPVKICGGGVEVVISSDAPGAVIYTGGYLDRPFSGIAVEPESFVPFSGIVEAMTSFGRNISYRFVPSSPER